jgi:hypothetical protein
MALAAASGAEDDWPSVLLLQKIKLHMREELQRQPDYTCLQTTQRYRREPGEKGDLAATDSILLEVLTAGGKELYGSPGARDFPAETPSTFTGGGMSGNGLFALHARALFVYDVAMFKHRGEEELLGRRLVRFDYRIPETLSGFTIETASGRGKMGTTGSFWADPATFDVVRMSVEGDDIPVRLRLVSVRQSVDYARTRIGERDVLLPQSAMVELMHESGEANRNAIEFTHCRSFTAESTVRFDEPTAPVGAAVAPAARTAEMAVLPAGLTVAVELTTAIAETDAVGMRVEGRVAADVVDRRKVVVAAGAVVHGRIRRLERHSDFGDYFVVGLEFTEVEVGGASVRFYAVFEDLVESGAVKLVLSRSARLKDRAGVEERYLPRLPGVASFFVVGKRLEMGRGLRTVWKTKAER